MTMQGITAIAAKTDQVTPARGSTGDDTVFGSLMNRQAARVSSHTSTSGVEAVTAAKNPADKKELAANRHSSEYSVKLDHSPAGQKVKDSAASMTPETKAEPLDVVEMEEMVAQTLAYLQQMFGLSPEELQDIMNQLSLQPKDLLFQADGGMITLVNTTAIQNLILGIHGIEDGSVFLTNDMLNQELTAVTQQITEILADGFGVDKEQLAALASRLQLDFAEQLEKMGQGTSAGEMTEGTVTGEGTVFATGDEMLSVVVENDQGEAGTGDGKQAMADRQSGAQAGGMPVSFTSAASAFTENLVQAFQEVHDTTGMNTESVMNQIVEQVVRQVRIRVMPETTSMELQLHPASLGRVSVTVATTAAGATASLVVENQMAKEALESQMIQLKESFVEQGLKVDAVEVTVAEFGFQKENQQQEEFAGTKKKNRRFRPDEELADDEETRTDRVTVSERRDVNSMVDYTA